MSATTTNWTGLAGNGLYGDAGNWDNGLPTSTMAGNIGLDGAIVQIAAGSILDAGITLGSVNGNTLEALGDVTYQGFSSIENTFSMTSLNFTLRIDAGTFTNDANLSAYGPAIQGTINIAAGATLANGALGTNGYIVASSGGSMTIGGGGTLDNVASILAYNTGTNLNINVPLSTAGGPFGFVSLEYGATVDIAAAVDASQQVNFAVDNTASPNGGTLIVGDLGQFQPEISTFYAVAQSVTTSDTIELPNIAIGETAPADFSFYETAGHSAVTITTHTAGGANVAGSLSFLDQSGAYTATNPTTGGFVLTADPAINGYVLTNTAIACFATGTRILTPDGEVPVERLRVGGEVISAFGGAATIVWIGHRHVVAAAEHANPEDVWPIRVRAGALGPAQPARDVLLSPEHAVHVAGVLVPVRLLVNGTTIVQEVADEITYWHVELPQHDVILADGLPAESYLDTGNRREAFSVAAPAPEEDANTIWLSRACAPQLRAGSRLAAIRAVIQSRAA